MIIGKEGISAKIIADSINEHGNRLTTFELEYPRFILAELNTHRMLSKNSASSRAIPVAKMLETIGENPAMPVYWGKNQPGMSAKEELTDLMEVKQTWKNASVTMIEVSGYLNQLGLHKQITNRITEPWQRMKTVITGTEWANLLWLRNHEDAQPEFGELARCIAEEFDSSTPFNMKHGDWHLPYVDPERMNIDYNLEQAIKLSVSLCAQVSYRKLDDSLEKALMIYDKLVGADRVHASPMEHQATPIGVGIWPEGVTHKDKQGNCWSGNFKNWVQYRQTVPGHAVW